MKTKNLFLVTMVLLFGAVIKSSGQLAGTVNALGSTYLGITNPVNSGWSVHFGNGAGINANCIGIPPIDQGMNCFIGNRSGLNTTTSNRNIFIGYQCGLTNTTGSSNTFIGTDGGNGNSIGSFNVGLGRTCGGEGDNNTRIGNSSGWANPGSNNVFLGHESGYSSQGSNNVFIGFKAGKASTDSNRLVICGNVPGNLIEGEFDNRKLKFNVNNGVGPFSSYTEINGNANASGLRFTNLTNTSNTYPNPLKKVLSVNATGDVILVDDQVGTGGGTSNLSNQCSTVNYITKSIDSNGNLNCSQIYDNWNGDPDKHFLNPSGVSIGYFPTPSSNIFQYTVTTYDQFGNPVITHPNLKLRVNGNTLTTSQFFTSDLNYKTHIEALDSPLDKILKLKGVGYNWDIANNPDMNFDEAYHTGFIAQDIEQVIPHVVITQDLSNEKDGKKLRKSVNYIELIPYLVESIKTLNERINGLEAQIQCLNETTGCNGAVVTKTNTTALASDGTRIISVSPNPSNDVVSVALSIEKSVQTATLNVYDLNGKLMSSLNINERSTNITKTLQKDNFGAGVYIVSLVVNGKSIDSKKIVFN